MLLTLVFLSFLIFPMSALSIKTVAIIGGGGVGSTLAKAIEDSGKAQQVLIGARDPSKTSEKLAKEGKKLKVEALTKAIADSEILILATPGAHTDEGIQDIAKSLGDVSGKVIIDATNPISEFEDGLQARWKQGTSGGEKLQEYLPDSLVYKAFNTLGVEHMADAAGKDMFYCGPENEKSIVADVISAVGFKPYYVGPIRYARNLEAMAELWIHCAIPPLPAKHMGRGWTFAVAGQPEE